MKKELLELENLEKEWNKAALEMVKARHVYHKAVEDRQKATERHRAAKLNYMVAKDKLFGVEPGSDND